MKNRQGFLSNKLNKYAIRKFTVGTASLLIGTTLVFGLNNEAKADELDSITTDKKTSGSDKGEALDIQDIKSMGENDTAKNDNEEKEIGDLEVKEGHRANSSEILSGENINTKHDDLIQEETTQSDIAHNRQKVSSQKNTKENSITEKSNQDIEQTNSDEQNVLLNEDKEEQVESKSDSENKTNTQPEKITKDTENPTQINLSENVTNKKNNEISNQEKVLKKDNDKDIKKEFLSSEGNHSESPKVDQEKMKLLKKDELLAGSSNEDINNEESKLAVLKTRANSVVSYKLDRSINEGTSEKINRLLGENLTATNTLKDGLDKIDQLYNNGLLADYEVETFKRSLLRRSSQFLNNKSQHDKWDNVINGGEDPDTKRELNKDVSGINQLFNDIKNLMNNRDTPNSHIKIVDDSGIRREDGKGNGMNTVSGSARVNNDGTVTAEFRLFRDWWDGEERYEVYAFRPSKEIADQIVKVTAKSAIKGNGKWESAFTEDKEIQINDLGYYALERPVSTSTNRSKGGSGGQVRFTVTFKGDKYIDPDIDWVQGYVLYDSKSPVITNNNAVGIFHENADITEIANEINPKVAENLVEKLENYYNESKQKYNDILKGVLITPNEQTEIKNFNDNITNLKKEANEIINKLPDNLKGNLPNRVLKINNFEVPEINDADGNGQVDTQDQADKAAIEDAIKEAQDAEQAAKDYVEGLNGVVSEASQEQVKNLNQAIEDAKAKAQGLIDQLPENTSGQADLQGQLDEVHEVEVPEINDADGNGQVDTQDQADKAAIEDAIKEAQDAEQAAKDYVEGLNGVVSEASQEQVKNLNQAIEDAKAKAQGLIDQLPENTSGQADLQGQLDEVHEVEVPEINDADGNGQVDTQDQADKAAIEDAIKEAQDAEQAAKDYVEGLNGVVSEASQEQVKNLNQAIEDAKAKAQGLIDQLPENTSGQADLQGQLDEVHEVEVPEINDADGNGQVDTQDQADKAAIEDAIKEAQDAEQAAKDYVEGLNGVVSEASQEQVKNLNQAIEDAKAKAQGLIDQLPENTSGQADLQGQLDEVHEVEVPEINDADGNGQVDTQDQADKAAIEDAIKEAQDAEQAAKDYVEGLNGVVSEASQEQVKNLNQAIEDAKAKAQGLIDQLPENTSGQADLQGQLDEVHEVEVPEINDADGNGQVDTQDQADKAAIEDAIKEAQDAEQAAKDYVEGLNGVVSEASQEQVKNLNQAIEDAKAKAQGLIDQLPENTSGQADLQGQLDEVHEVEVPEINDADGNGQVDTQDQADKAAIEDAIKEAQDAEQAAKDYVEGLNGVVSEASQEQVKNLNQAIEDAKAKAQGLIDQLPENTSGQADLQGQLDEVHEVEVPEINDADGNGQVDTQDQADKAAIEDAIKEAQDAEQAAKDYVEGLNGVVSEASQEQVKNLNQAIEDAKAKAQGLIDQLPENTSGQADLQGQLDEVHEVEVPEINDADGNGQVDTQDQADKAAIEDAIKEAQDAEQAAKDYVEGLNGVVSEASQEQVKNLNQAIEDAKAKAQGLIDQLPENTSGQADLQGQLDEVHEVEVPEINDADGNGQVDTQDQADKAAIEDAIKEAQDAEQAAKDYVEGLNGVVSEASQEQVKNLNQAIEDAKAKAQGLIDQLPENTSGQADLQGQLDEVHEVEVPEINDADGNGQVDTQDQADKAAIEDAIKEAQDAEQAAKDYVEGLNGVVSEASQEQVKNLNQAIEDAKAKAQGLIDQLPENTSGQADLQGQLDEVHEVEVPEINDADGNGQVDTQDQADKAAIEDAIKEAQDAEQAAKDYVEGLNGVVSEASQEQVKNLNQAIEDAKAKAQGLIDQLPENTSGQADLQGQLDEVHEVEVPEINDADGNGQVDTQDQADKAAIEDAIKEAQDAEQAAKDYVEGLNGVVSEASQEQVKNLNQAIEDAKAKAQGLIDQLPENTSGQADLQGQLDEVHEVEVPEINDADGNGQVDTQDQADKAAIEDAIKEAQDAEQAAKDYVEGLNGVVSEASQEQVKNLNQAIEDAKAKAQGLIDQLPENTSGQADLQGQLDEVHEVEVPEINDADGNGQVDTQDQADKAAIEDAIKEAQDAEQAAKDYVEGLNGVVSEASQEQVKNLNQAIEDAKAKAQGLIDQLPENTSGQADLQGQLDEVHEVEVPEINDADGNGQVDTQDQADKAAIEDAIKEAQDAEQAAKDYVEGLNGVVSEASQEQVKNLNQAIEDAKAKAQGLIDQLPENTSGQADLQGQLDEVHEVEVPEINDADGNGQVDTQDQADKAAIEDAIKEAQDAEQAAKDYVEGLNGVVSEASQEQVKNLNQAIEDAKAKAQGLIDQLPENTSGQADLQGQLDEVHEVEVPEINDADGNGQVDTQDQADKAAIEDAIKEAQDAEQAAKDYVEGLNGVVSEASQEQVKNLNQAIEDAKAKAQGLIDQLPENTSGQADLQGQLDEVHEVEVPEINDADGNGQVDTQDQADKAAIEDAIKEAQDAEQAAKDYVEGLNGVVSEASQEQVKNLNQAIEDAKAKAQGLIDQLPENTSGQADLQGQLDEVHEVEVPEINDADGNGQVDTQDQADKAAIEDAIKEAQDAEQAAKDYVEGLNGVVSEASQEQVKNLNQAIEDAKAKAQGLIDQLPENTSGQADLQGQLDEVHEVEVPEINDADGNGQVDTQDQADKAAIEDAIKEAQDAEQAAKDYVEGLNGVVSEASQEQVKNLNQAIEDAKAKAQGLIDQLPENTSGQADLQGQLDEVHEVEVPEINDADGNGQVDTQDQADKAAIEDAIKEAQDAEQAAKDYVEGLNGVVSEASQEQVKNLNQAIEDAKAKAQGLIDQLPENTSGQADLQGQLDEVHEVEVPEINDADGNGQVDTQDQADKAAIEDAIKEAQDAEQAAKDYVEGLNGVVSEASQEQVKNLNQAIEDAKAKAQGLIDQLPENTSGQADLQGQLDEVHEVEVPEINDADGNGQVDTQDQADKAAIEDAIKEAQDAEQAAKDYVEGLNGVVSEASQEQVKNLNQAIEDAKAKAQGLIDQLPENTSGQADLQGQLDEVHEVEVPEINDADGNGQVDTQDQADKAAIEDAIKEAQDAEQAAKDYVEGLNGVVSEASQEQVKNLNQAIEDAKAKAQGLIDQLPENTSGQADLQGQLDEVHEVEVPEINDADGNGQVDTQDQADKAAIEDAIKEAQDAEQAAKDYVEGLNGVVSEASQEQVKNLNQAIEDAKAKAQGLIDQLPENTSGQADLQGQLDEVHEVEVPEINDADGNGQVDTQDQADKAAIEDAIKEAQDAEQAAKDYVEGLNGVVSEASQEQVKNLNQAIEDAKAKAQGLIDQLPENTSGQADLQGQLDEVHEVEVPEINDADGNGQVDTQDQADKAAIEDAIKEAQDAEQAAKDYVEGLNGVVSEASQEQVKNLNQAIEDAKAKAQGLIDQLPENTSGQADLQGQLDEVHEVEVPEINDADGNGQVDTQDQADKAAIEDAIKEAQDAEQAAKDYVEGLNGVVSEASQEQVKNLNQAIEDAKAKAQGLIDQLPENTSGQADLQGQLDEVHEVEVPEINDADGNGQVDTQDQADKAAIEDAIKEAQDAEQAAKDYVEGLNGVVSEASQEQVKNLNQAIEDAKAKAQGLIDQLPENTSGQADLQGQLDEVHEVEVPEINDADGNGQVDTQDQADKAAIEDAIKEAQDAEQAAKDYVEGLNGVVSEASQEQVKNLNQAIEDAKAKAQGLIDQLPENTSGQADLQGQLDEVHEVEVPEINDADGNGQVDTQDQADKAAIEDAIKEAQDAEQAAKDYVEGLNGVVSEASQEQVKNLNQAIEDAKAKAQGLIDQLPENTSGQADLQGQLDEVHEVEVPEINDADGNGQVDTQDQADKAAIEDAIKEAQDAEQAAKDYVEGLNGVVSEASQEQVKNLNQAIEDAKAKAQGLIDQLPENTSGQADLQGQLDEVHEVEVPEINDADGNGQVDTQDQADKAAIEDAIKEAQDAEQAAKDYVEGLNGVVSEASQEQVKNLNQAIEDAKAKAQGLIDQLPENTSGQADLQGQLDEVHEVEVPEINDADGNGQVDTQDQADKAAIEDAIKEAQDAEQAAKDYVEGLNGVVSEASQEQVKNLNQAIEDAKAKAQGLIDQLPENTSGQADLQGQLDEVHEVEVPEINDADGNGQVDTQDQADKAAIEDAIKEAQDAEQAAKDYVEGLNGVVSEASQEQVKNLNQAIEDAKAKAQGLIDQLPENTSGQADLQGQLDEVHEVEVPEINDADGNGQVDTQDQADKAAIEDAIKEAQDAEQAAKDYVEGLNGVVSEASQEQVKNLNQAIEDAKAKAQGLIDQLPENTSGQADLQGQLDEVHEVEVPEINDADGNGQVDTQDQADKAAIEDAIKEAQDAEQAAKDYVEGLNGVVSEASQEQVKNLNQAIEDAKAKAQGLIDQLPENTSGQADLQGQLDEVHEVEVPEINDADGNGQVDTQDQADKAAIEDAIKEAQDAEQAAKDYVEGLNGVVSEASQEQVKNLNQAIEDAKAKAQGLIDQLPENTSGQADLQGQLDEVHEVEVPEINDADGNGQVDTQDQADKAAIEDAIKEAQDAEQAAKDYVEGLNGVVSEASQEQVKNLNQAIEDAKAKAQGLIDQLPENTSGQADLQGQLDEVHEVEVPEINDADGNGQVDTQDQADKAAIEDAIKEAQDAEQAAKDYVEGLNGVVSEASQEQVKNLNQAIEDAKAKAQGLIDQLPENTSGQADLQGQLDEVHEVEVPEINDADGNGQVDTQDQADKAAIEDAIKEAQDAEQAAKDYVEGLNGVVSEASQEQVKNLNQAIEDAKAKAQGLIDQLPENTSGQADLQGQLDEVHEVEVPEINDADGNGQVDTQDQADKAAIEDAIKEAQDAEQAAKDYVEGLNGVVSEASQEQVKNLNQAIEDAKAKAQGLIDQLPENTSGQADLQGQLDEVHEVEVPEINDADGNGQVDTQDQADKAAIEDAIKEAQDAEQAAKDYVEGLNGVVSEASQEQVKNLNQAIEDAKAKAQGLIDQLPENTSGQADLQGQLDEVHEVEVPEINDADGNGQVDTQDQADKAAIEDAIKEAQDAEQAAKDYVEGLNGVVSEASQEQVKNLNQAIEDAKAKAQGLIDQLPENTSGQADLQGQLDEVHEVEVPEINDADGNGQVDTQDQADKAAIEDAIKEAQDAEQAAKDYVEGLNGVVSEASQEQVKNLNQAIEDAKAKAQGLIDQLPENTSGQADLQGQLDEVHEVEVPEINDADGNGQVDTQDQADKAAIEDAIKEAQDAEQAAKDYVEGLNGVVSEASQEQVKNLNQAIEDAKAKAQGLIDQLPENTSGQADLQGQLDEVHEVEVPEINDADGNGQVDTQDQADKAAIEDAIKEAQDAEQAAKDYVEGLNGVVSEASQEQVKNLNQAIEDAKAKAQGLIDQLPENTSGQADLQGQLDEVHEVEVPEINDADGNGQVDTQDQADKAAIEDAIKEAQDAEQAAKDYVEGLNGVVSEASQEQVKNLNQAIEDAKAKAQGLIDQLPENTSGQADLQGQLDEVHEVEVPEINDADGNGQVDTQDQADKAAIEDAIKEAQDAEQAAKDYVEGLNGVVSEASQEQVKNLNQAIEDAKAKAQGLIDQLPENTSGQADLQGQLDEVHEVEVPEINDADGNGQVDTQDQADKAAIEDAIKEAQDAEQAAKDYVEGLNGVVSEASQEQVKNLNQAIEDAKAKAQGLIDQLPENTSGQADLQGQLDEVHEVEVPEINDADGNGQVDTQDQADKAAIEDAIKEAQDAEQAAKDYVEGLNGVVSEASQEQVKNLNQAIEDAKAKAQGLIDQLPENTSGQADLQGQLDEVHEVEVPEINDADGNGQVDTQDQADKAAIEDAIKEAQDAEQAAKDYVEGLNGVVSEASQEQVKNLNQAIEDAKAKAQGLIDQLPENTSGQADLQGQLDEVHEVEVPEINDADGNGQVDTQDQADKAAIEDAIKEAQDAEQAAKDYVEGLNGVVSEASQEQVKNLNQAIEDAKAKAQGLIDQLPENTSGQADLQGQLDEVHEVEVPEINDADGNGQVDTQDQADKAAIEDAIKEAQDAEQAAKDYVEGLNGVVSEASQEQVKNLNQAIEDAKAKAQGLIDQLPENTSGQADLQGQLDEVHEVEVPEINDADGNGQVDTQDQADKAAIEDAIKEAQDAEQAAKDYVEGLNGVVSEASQEQVKNLNQAIEDAKAKAQGLIDQLPENTSGQADLQGQLDEVHEVEVPEINDADGNGQVDTQDQADKAAIEDAIKEAQDAEQAAKDYVEGLNGVVSEASQEQVKNLNQAIEDAKAKAQGLIDQLPENTSGQADLQGQLDEVHEVEVPEINDADGNGQVDTQDQADKAAIEDAIKEAQDAEQAAKDYVEGLNGVVSEASQEQVKNLNQAIEDAKAKAQGLIDQLPENTSGQADLQGQLDEVHEVEVPEINDADGNIIYKTTSIIGNKNNQQKVAIDNKTIEKDLPETGETDTDNGTIFASLFATIGSLLLFVKRRKTKEDEK